MRLAIIIMLSAACSFAQTEQARIHTVVHQKVESCPCSAPTLTHDVVTYWVSSPLGEFLEWKEHSWTPPLDAECYDVELWYEFDGNMELWAKRPSALGIIRTGGMPNGWQADEPIPLNDGYQLLIRSRSCPETGVAVMALNYSSNVNGIKPLPEPGDVPVVDWASKWTFQAPGAEIITITTSSSIVIPEHFLGDMVYLVGSGSIESISCRPGKSLVLRSYDNADTITVTSSVGRIGGDKVLDHRSDLLGIMCAENGVLLEWFSDNGA